jgi:hypothetical protein
VNLHGESLHQGLRGVCVIVIGASVCGREVRNKVVSPSPFPSSPEGGGASIGRLTGQLLSLSELSNVELGGSG